MTIAEIEKYTKTIIPNLEEELATNKNPDELLKLYELYHDILVMVAPYDFITYNKALEFHEDKTDTSKGFYHHRKDHMEDVFVSLNDMEIYDKYDMLLMSMPPRLGKEQPLYSKILTPDGWKTMGDMKIGDKVVGEDGNSYNVTGVFPQGEKDVYEVAFDDGTKVHCGLEHLWEVQTRYDRIVGKSRVVDLKTIIENLYVENGTRKNYSIKYTEPVKFNGQLDKNDIDPYLLGILIGDGSLTNGVRITNMDEDILNNVKGAIPDSEKLVRVGDTISYDIKSKVQLRNDKGYPIPCNTLMKVREYGLDVTSHDKFIPRKFLYADVNSRLELLRGLMDSDGSNVSNSSYNEYTTVSKQLSSDIVELIRSLGGRATVGTKVGSYKKNGVKVECSKVYRVIFNMEINPYKCSRKKSEFIPRTVRKYKYINSVELVGRYQSQCIMVDNPTHLYITDGYNITHNTTTGIRFLSWIMGRHPEKTQLATSYSDSITSSFYVGVMEIILGEMYPKIFPNAPLVNQNAKKQEIWLKTLKRYPTIGFIPIRGSMTGRGEAGNYIYFDDLVSGIEEAMSIDRMEKLWTLYTTNSRQRKKDGAKEIHIATRWSVHDPITKLANANRDNPRCKIISMSCYDENGESNFDFEGGFSTEYYKDIESTMEKVNFNALYKSEPIERDGLLYNEDELQYYLELPNERPDAIIAVCDSKNLGKDYVSSPIGYVYGDYIYIDDVVYNSGLPEVTIPLVAQAYVRNNVTRADIEMNNGGNYYAENVGKLVKQLGGNTSIRLFFSSNNKDVKIITYSQFVKEHFIFRHKSTYKPNSEYARFMEGMLTWTQVGKNKNDDAPDSIAMMAQLFQEMTFSGVKVLSRKELRL